MNLGQFTADMILEYLENKIRENNIKYPDIWFKTMMQPGNVQIPFKELSDQQIKESLFMQIQNMYSYSLSTINKINE